MPRSIVYSLGLKYRNWPIERCLCSKRTETNELNSSVLSAWKCGRESRNRLCSLFWLANDERQICESKVISKGCFRHSTKKNLSTLEKNYRGQGLETCYEFTLWKTQGPVSQKSRDFRAYFGCHNSLYTFGTPRFSAIKLRNLLDFSCIKNLLKDQLLKTSGLQIHKTPTRLFCKASLFMCCKGNQI